MKLCYRRCPQQGRPVAIANVSDIRQLRFRHRFPQRHNPECLLDNIIKANKDTIRAIMMVVVWVFKVSHTLAAAVLSVNCIVMHMKRRQRRHWQIAGQQNNRGNISLQMFHLSNCKITTIYPTGQSPKMMIFSG